MQAITAVKPKNQAKVTRFIKADASYDKLIDQGKDGSLQAERAYCKASDYFDELPLYERKNIKSHGILGY